MQLLSRLARACPRLTAVALGLVLALALVALIELLFFGLNRYRADADPYYVYSRKFHQLDKLLGYKPIPLIRVEVTKKLNDHIIYETSYAFDAYSRRITPVNPPLKRQKFIAFFGCSMTFGEGVQEDETMPYYVGQLAPDYTPYNYGFSGYGPQMMLANLQAGQLKRELQEGSGVLIYLFFGAHIGRATGSMQGYNSCSHDLPYYTINSQNELVRKGTFTTGRPLLSLLYWIIGKSEFARYFKMDLPPKITADQIRLTARIIEESCRAYHRLFPGSTFCLVIYSGSKSLAGEMPGLRQAGVKILDYSGLWWHGQPGYTIEHDGHPTALAHRDLAAHLVHDLGLRPNESRIPPAGAYRRPNPRE